MGMLTGTEVKESMTMKIHLVGIIPTDILCCPNCLNAMEEMGTCWICAHPGCCGTLIDKEHGYILFPDRIQIYPDGSAKSKWDVQIEIFDMIRQEKEEGQCQKP